MGKFPGLAVLTSALSITLLTAGVQANETLGTGEDFYFSGYGSYVHDAGSTSGYLWAFTEGEGTDLNRARVEADIYVNGQKITTKIGSGVSYASTEYNASATRITKLKIASTHYVYNKANESKKRSSDDQWP